jgi:DNA-binding GntR family transcriptional regulator
LTSPEYSASAIGTLESAALVVRSREGGTFVAEPEMRRIIETVLFLYVPILDGHDSVV